MRDVVLSKLLMRNCYGAFARPTLLCHKMRGASRRPGLHSSTVYAGLSVPSEDEPWLKQVARSLIVSGGFAHAHLEGTDWLTSVHTFGKNT